MSPAQLGIHGTASMYLEGKCDCEPCTRAAQVHIPHGTKGGRYKWRCKCEKCAAPSTARVPSTPRDPMRHRPLTPNVYRAQGDVSVLQGFDQVTDTYRTAVNPYTAKAAEARAKLEGERTAAVTREADCVALLAEVNAGLAPFEVYRQKGQTFQNDTVRLTHPDSGITCYLCDEEKMLEELPRRVGTAYFATKIEAIEADIKKRAARKAMLRRLAEPVGVSIGGTLLSCVVFGFEWGRVAFVLVCTLAFNLWYFGTFKRSPP